jgi:sigma-B regulation protein RsbU (phosphoserine phosphatase)
MAGAVGQLVGELLTAQHAVWQREAELAAGVPVVVRPDEPNHLAARLQAVLRAGAESVGCRTSALYLLDEATTSLKMRSCWGMPRERLLAPPRPLQGSLADLEAMLGHAVVLNNEALYRQWNAPEQYATAVCVPVSSPSTIFGTLWVFADQHRDFSEQQTNMLELVAGRIAADLEREMLLNQSASTSHLFREMETVRRFRRNQLPVAAPWLDGWEIAGWSAQDVLDGGNFHDWFCLPDGLVASVVGQVEGKGLEAALGATTLRTSVRCHGQCSYDPARILHDVNLTVWTGAAGDLSASLAYLLIDTKAGNVRYALAGAPIAAVFGRERTKILSDRGVTIGLGPEATFSTSLETLQPGETLAILSPGLAMASQKDALSGGEPTVFACLREHLNQSAKQTVLLARERLESLADTGPTDASLVVVKRTNP